MSIAILSIVGCSDDETLLGPNNTIVGFVSPSMTKNFFTDVTDAELLVPITLISYQDEQLPQEDIVLNWKIVQSTAADAAIPGTDYDLPSGGSGVATISAGQTVSSFVIGVHPIALDPSTPKKITIVITSASNSIVGKQYEKQVITLQGVCASSLEGAYANNDVPTDQATITALGNANYLCSGMPFIGFSGGTVPVPFEFSDTCGIITIESEINGGQYYMQGSGVVNADDSITITYKLFSGNLPAGTPLFDFSAQPSTYFP